MKKLFRFTVESCSNIIKNETYYYLLLLNIISNCAAAYIHKSISAILMMVLLSFASAFIETAFIQLLKIKKLKLIIISLFAALHNILIVADFFIISNFGKIFNQDIIDIIAETNPIETQNFLNSYLNISNAITYILIIAVLNYILWKISKVIYKNIPSSVSFILTTGGLVVWGIMCYSYILFHQGISIPQYTAITRVAYSYHILKQRIEAIDTLYITTTKTKATKSEDSPSVVVILGESYSVFHSSLYGYEKNTNPLLFKLKEEGKLLVFDDVVTSENTTHGAMHCIFSLDSLGNGFTNKTLFPVCFKASGYRTYLYDNQYFEGEGVNFLSSSKLSNQMFNYRNKKRHNYDLDMIKEIDADKISDPFLCVIHLWGQHYTYSERYPKNFNKFKPKDYDKTMSLSNREIISYYDNALLYNDFVVNSIIKKFDNKDCIIIYVSDHGEEVYENGDFMGHGNTLFSKEIKYQIRVPLMVYATKEFKEKRPNVFRRLTQLTHIPIITDDISHFILDIAEIKHKDLNYSRSLYSPYYNKKKHRVVLNSIDYDNR